MERPAEISLISRRSCELPPSSLSFARQSSGTTSEGWHVAYVRNIRHRFHRGYVVRRDSAIPTLRGGNRSLRLSSSLYSAELLTKHSASKYFRIAFPACPSCRPQRPAALNSKAMWPPQKCRPHCPEPLLSPHRYRVSDSSHRIYRPFSAA